MKIQEQMSQLRLSGMKQRYQSLVETNQFQNLTAQESLELLLQAEQENRNNKRTDRLLSKAKFRYKASLSEIAYLDNRNLDKQTMAQLADGVYINKGQAVIITGATGCGKSFLASALGQQACMLGYKVVYYSMSKLFNQLRIARIDNTINKLFKQIENTSLLILDDFGLSGIDQQQALDLMEIIEDRHGQNATIIASQLPISAWYDIIQDSTIADAILDRLLHTATRIELKGDSLRKNR